MLKLVINMLFGMKEAVKEEVEKKIGDKELAPNLLKLVNFFFLLIKSVFNKEEKGIKSFLVRHIPILLTVLGVILKDLLDDDKVTTDLSDVDFELLD